MGRYRITLVVIILIACQCHSFMMKISNNIYSYRRKNAIHFGKGEVQTVSDTYKNVEGKTISTISALDGIYLVSLPPLSDDAPRIVRDVWKWKGM